MGGGNVGGKEKHDGFIKITFTITGSDEDESETVEMFLSTCLIPRLRALLIEAISSLLDE